MRPVSGACQSDVSGDLATTSCGPRRSANTHPPVTIPPVGQVRQERRISATRKDNRESKSRELPRTTRERERGEFIKSLIYRRLPVVAKLCGK